MKNDADMSPEHTPTVPKIVQLILTPNDSIWQGVLLGLGDDGATYYCDKSGRWAEYIPPIGPA